MDELVNKLKIFIDENNTFIDEDEKQKIYLKYGVDRIFNEQERNLVNKYTLITRLQVLKQKKLNQYLERELYIIADKLNEENIKWVHLKGTTLARQIYKKPEYRNICDIDILINIKDIEKVFMILTDLGFESQDKDTIIAEYKLNEFDKNHLDPMVKFISSEGLSVILELHTEIVPYTLLNINNKVELTSELLNSKMEFLVNSKSIYVLNSNNNIIFLVLHCFKHFMVEINYGFLNGKFTNISSLNLIHDIALYIDKYNANISWSFIIEKLIELNIEYESYLILSLENKIYNNINESLLKMLKKNEKPHNFSSSKFSAFLSNLEVKDLVFGSMKKYVNEMIDRNSNNRYECYSINNNDDRKGIFNIVESPNQKIYRHIVTDQLNYAEKISCCCYFTWNENSLCLDVSYRMEDYLKNKDYYYYMYFFIDTLNRNDEESYVRYLKIKFDIFNLDNGIQIYEILPIEKTWSIEGYKAKTILRENTCHITIEFPWEKLDVNPEKGLEIRFDLCILASDGEKYTQLSLSNSSYYWYDIFSYSKLILV